MGSSRRKWRKVPLSEMVSLPLCKPGYRRILLSAPRDLPMSSVPGLERYAEEICQRRRRAEENRDPGVTSVLGAELKSIQEFIAEWPSIDYLSCNNSPFVSQSNLRAGEDRIANYALWCMYGISRGTHHRFLKTVALLLCELRFVILREDAIYFSRLNGVSGIPRETTFTGLGGGDCVVTGEQLAMAFQASNILRCCSSRQACAHRKSLCDSRNSVFAKNLLESFQAVKKILAGITQNRRLLASPEMLRHLETTWAAAGLVTAESLKEVQRPDYWASHLSRLLSRVRSFRAACVNEVTGTKVDAYCRQMCALLTSSFSPFIVPSSSAEVFLLEANLFLQFVMDKGHVAQLEAAVDAFFHVVRQQRCVSPELGALNDILRWYGINDAEVLSYEADVADGDLKRKSGDTFEDRMSNEGRSMLVSRVLVPHCSAVMQCDEDTARVWVEACLRCDGAQPYNPKTAPVWPGLISIDQADPPEYRLLRNIQYLCNDGPKQNWRIAGELDGVIFDARTRHILFVMEAKRNMADLGKAAAQKMRLYKALDAAFQEVPHTSLPTTAAPTSALNKNAPPVAPTELRFVVPSVPAAASHSMGELGGAAEVDGTTIPSLHLDPLGDMSVTAHEFDRICRSVEVGKPDRGPTAKATEEVAEKPMGSDKVSTGSSATIFTQENFREYFCLAPPPCLTNSLRDSVQVCSTVSAAFGREQRWIYLTSLEPEGTAEWSTSVPAPGGMVMIIEEVLVSVAAESIAQLYHACFPFGGPPCNIPPALRSLISSMYRSSFCASPVEGVTPVFWLHLEVPSPGQLRLLSDSRSWQLPTSTVETPEARYRYAFDLWKNRVDTRDGVRAVQGVRFSKDFFSEMDISESALLHAVRMASTQFTKRLSKYPSFAGVIALLLEQGCLRNLVILSRGRSSEP